MVFEGLSPIAFGTIGAVGDVQLRMAEHFALAVDDAASPPTRPCCSHREDAA